MVEHLNENQFNGVELKDLEEVPTCPDTAEEPKSAEPKSALLRVYKKKSTFKGAKDTDVWYSATRSDGNSVSVVFKCPIKTDSQAFEISNVVGTMKKKEVIKEGETYTNFTYYVSSCDFSEIVGEELPL